MRYLASLLLLFVSFSPNASPKSPIEPQERYRELVEGILSAWDEADLVCLGEAHLQKNDSDLRIALVSHPQFVLTVDVIVVEFANPLYQEILDRFVVEGQDVSFEDLSKVWRNTSVRTLWDSPIYEKFIRAVREANLRVTREERVRLLGGVPPIDWQQAREANDRRPRGYRRKYIQEAIRREVLDKGLKGLAIYGSGHFHRGRAGFSREGNLPHADKVWVAFSFNGRQSLEEGRNVFSLGPDPKLIPIAGTEHAELPALTLFPDGGYDAPPSLGDLLDAIIYYGDVESVFVLPDSSVVSEEDLRGLNRGG